MSDEDIESGEEPPSAEDKFEQILDGGPIVAAVSNLAIEFFEAAFPALEKSVEKIVESNTTDDKMRDAMNEMTLKFMKQLEARLESLFSDAANRASKLD